MSIHRKTVTIEKDGYSVILTGTYIPRLAGDGYLTPPIPAKFEIYRVEIPGGDITALFGDLGLFEAYETEALTKIEDS